MPDPSSVSGASEPSAGTRATAPPARQNEYRRDIDGVRAIAVVAVVLFHAGVRALRGGFVGVDVFFVISGYLIGAHIYRDVRDRRFSLARFYQRRAKRILPALFAVLLACYALALFVLSPEEMVRFGRFSLSTLLSISNFYAWWKSGYFDPSAAQNPLLMTWTLAVEEQFYVFFPLLMLALARWSFRREHNQEGARRLSFWTVTLFSGLSLALCIFWTPWRPLDTFFLIPFRAWELAAGVLMALYEAQPQAEQHPEGLYGGARWSNLRAFVGLAMILVAVTVYTSATPFPGATALVPVVGAVLLLSAPRSWLNRNVLSWQPARWIGLISYSLYLWHWPLLSFAAICVGHEVAVHVALVLCLIAVLFASLSYRFIETPFRASRRAPVPLLWRYALVCALVALPALIMTRTHGLPQRYPAVAHEEQVISSEDHACFGENELTASPHCLPPPDGRPAVALLGDSHANAFADAVRARAAAAGMRTLVMVHYWCPPLPGVAPHRDPYFIGSCTRFSQASFDRTLHDPTVTTVVLTGWWSGPLEVAPGERFGYVRPGQGNVDLAQSDANLSEALDAEIKAFRNAGKRVIVLSDPETLGFDVPSRMKQQFIPVRHWIAEHLGGPLVPLGIAAPGELLFPQERQHEADLIARVAHQDGAEVFDTHANLCPATGCLVSDGRDLLYQDYHHLTRAGAEVGLRGFHFVTP